MAFVEGADALLPDVIQAFCPLARELGVDWFTLSLPANDERVNRVRNRFVTRVWPSRLYRVSWPDDVCTNPLRSDLPVLPEAALL